MFYCCKVLKPGCDAVDDCMCPKDRPSPIFATFSTIMNLVIAILTVIPLVTKDKDTTCTSSNVNVWLCVAILICCLNVVFAFYLYYKFSKLRRSGEHLNETVGKIFMYDPGVYVYVWTIVFIVVWVAMGFAWAKDEENCKDKADGIKTVAVLFIVYLCLMMVAMLFSLCIECCNGGVRRRETQTQLSQQPYNATTTPFIPQQQSMAPPPPLNPNYGQQPAYYPPPQQYQQQQQQQPRQSLMSAVVGRVFRMK